MRSVFYFNRLFRDLKTAALVAVFLFAQTAALIHSEIHPFHEHSAQCDVYAGVEHQAADAPVAFLVPLLVGLALALVIAKPAIFFSQTFIAFQARAPPFSFSNA